MGDPSSSSASHGGRTTRSSTMGSPGIIIDFDETFFTEMDYTDIIPIPSGAAATVPACKGCAREDKVDQTMETSSAQLRRRLIEQPLIPFVCPPPPLFTRRKYFSLYSGNEVGVARHCLSGWEKKAILSKIQGPVEMEMESFKQRLLNVHYRNRDPYIEAVQLRRAREMELELQVKKEVFARDEKHRMDIYFRFKNLPMLRTIDKFINRAEIWYTTIVAHVFITALVQERKVQRAIEKLAFLMAPMIRRYLTLRRMRRERAKLVEEMLPSIPFPSSAVIRSMDGNFFKYWPEALLDALAQRAKPRYLRKGEYLMHEGDAGRAMFFITLGQVLIVIKKKNKNKSRSVKNSSGAFPLKAPVYVGEFALVCREPRTASIRCETDIGFWTISPEDYEEISRYLSPFVLGEQRKSTDDRRRQNLKRLFPLKETLLRKLPYFEKFSQESLLKIIDKVEPIVLHDGDFLIEEGAMDSSVYFIQDGIAVHLDEDGNETPVNTGTCLGMFDCACGVNEKKKFSVVSVNYCDIWRMSRDLLMDVGLSEPHALMHCRKAARQARAKEIVKEGRPPSVFRMDPYLNFCFPWTLFARLYQLCVPCVFLNGEKIVLMGQNFTSMVIILKGTVDITVATNTEQETFRATTLNEEGRQKKGSDLFQNLLSGHTFVFGAYEFAASLNKYFCTASSVGVVEALVVEMMELNAVLPPELRSIMQDYRRGREFVTRLYQERSFTSVMANQPVSFKQQYQIRMEKERKKQLKREGIIH